MRSRTVAGLLMVVGVCSASACTQLLGGFDFSAKGTGAAGTGGGTSNSTTGSTGGASTASSGHAGGGGMTSTSSSSTNSSSSSGSECAGGLVACGGAGDAGGCVDEQTDDNNCGSCGKTCPSGATCTAGACMCCDGTVCNPVPTWYQDLDGDGFGNVNVATAACTRPTGYVMSSTDCCDTDALAFPGQTAWFMMPDQCGSYDYNCDGMATVQTPATTDCAEALVCAFSAPNMCGPAHPAPAGCNGEFTDIGAAACGAMSSVDVAYCIQEGSDCSEGGSQGFVGPQACH
jgi:hypothetical protein